MSTSLSPCEAASLAHIRDVYGPVLLLTVEQVAQLLGTTGNNLAQMLRRGHVPFDTVRLGSRVFFPVLYVASWLCGAVIHAQPATVALPKKTATRVRSSADLRARLFAVHELVERKGRALRNGPPVDIEQAEKLHAAISALLVALSSAPMSN